MAKLIICLFLFLVNFSFVFAQETAEQRLEGFIKAMGGREAWASIKGVHLTVTHHTTTVRLPFKNVIWNDFETPRHRIEASNTEYKRVLIWQKSGDDWIKEDNEKARLLTDQEESNEARWWESNPYRTINRLAKNDSKLSVKLIEPDRLGVFRQDGVRVCWFRLNQLNEPIAFGTWASEEATIFGPLMEANVGLKHPKWTARPDGRWRAESVKFEFSKESMKFETEEP